MRVSYDVTAVPDKPVGAGRYTIDLAQALLERADVEMLMWARRHDRSRWEELGAPHRAVHAEAPTARPARLLWEQIVLPRSIRAEQIDVHHAPHYTMPERASVPVVVTVHDLTFFDHPEWHQRAKVPFFRRAIRKAAQRADAIVCVSQRTAELLEAKARPKGRVFVVPHGVDHARFSPLERSAGTDAAVLERLRVTGRYVLFVGTIEPRKSVPDLIRAFALVRGHDDASLVLAGGPGWGADEVTRAIDETGLGDRVARLGYVADQAVPALLRRAVAVAYPAREEGFGLPALEALACGSALVTTAGTAMAEVAGSSAVLVAPGDVEGLAAALAECLEGGPEVEQRRRMGIEVASHYTWERSAEGHMEAYRWAVQAGAVGTDR